MDVRLGANSDGDADGELRSDICVYLIAERPEGATVQELAKLTMGGLSPILEITRVSRAVSELIQVGEVMMEGGKVCPVAPE